MRLESARDLKQQLLSEVVAPVAASASRIVTRSVMALDAADQLAATTTFGVGARSFDSVPALQRSVALGVARHKGEYRLAVRVQRPSLMAAPLVEHLVRQAKGEADVRMIGRIDKRTASGRVVRTRRPERAARGVTGAAVATPWYRSNTRPLLIGASIAHVDVTAGTLGAFVAQGERVFALSNNHVLANEDAARSGDWVVQRARYDGGRQPRDRVARLRAWIRMKRRGANFVDAALAALEPGIEFDPNLLRQLVGGRDRRLGGLGPDLVDEGETLYKVGRTTGPSKGRVTAFDLDNVVVNYDLGNLRFDGQIEIEGHGRSPFSDGGDSGSLIVNRDMQAVALLFAGGESGGSNGLGLTYANPIHRVLDDLDATLLS